MLIQDIKRKAELCLLATKGKISRINASISQIIETVRERHSQKPNEVRKKIVEFCGDIPRVELFARQKTEGWDAIGDGIDGQDIRKTLENMVK